jgi:phosphoglycolate phosphatase
MAALLLRGTELGDVDAVLFDKDGTISHSEPELLSLAQSRLRECLAAIDASRRPALQFRLEEAYGLEAGGVHPAGITAVATREHNLLATATALAQVGLGWPEALATSEAVFERCDRSAHAASATTAGAVQAMERLTEAGIRCAVISNDNRNGIKRFLDSHGLTHQISAIWSADHAPRKPNPAAVHGLLAELEIEVSRCALIGDASSDLHMAVAAGIPARLALGYTAGWSQPPPLGEPHPLIHHWSELTVRPLG